MLADLLNLTPSTAVGWVNNAGGDWSRYAAALANDAITNRRNSTLPPPTSANIRRHDDRLTGLEAGVSMKVISDRLGHSEINLTMDTYAHLMPPMDEDAAATLEASIFGKGC